MLRAKARRHIDVMTDRVRARTFLSPSKEFRTDRAKTVDWDGAARDNIDRNINHNNLDQFLSHPALFP